MTTSRLGRKSKMCRNRNNSRAQVNQNQKVQVCFGKLQIIVHDAYVMILRILAIILIDLINGS
jgi:hypothetical protein